MAISRVAVRLPSEVVTSRQVSSELGMDEGFLTEKVGVVRRHVLGSWDNRIEMAAEAAREVLSFAKDAPGSVFLVTQNPTRGIPHDSALLHGALGLDSNVACVDLGLACTGFVHGLLLAETWRTGFDQRPALLVTADAYSMIVDPRDRATAPIFGDAITATLLDSSGTWAIVAGAVGTDSSKVEAIARPPRGNLEMAPEIASSGISRPLHMDGRHVVAAVLEHVPSAVLDLLQGQKLATSDIDLFVFHQASAHMITQLAVSLDLDPKRVPIALAHTGNTVSSSIPLVLSPVLGDKAHEYRHAKRILLCGFGVGFSWALALLERTRQ